MLKLSKTTPYIYVSSILALNIISPEHTGDWHSSVYWEHPEYSKLDLWIFGEGQKFNTNYFLGELGIIDGTERLNQMGYYQEYTPVWIADHPRAFTGMLCISVFHSGITDTLILDDWFPGIEDKERVYKVISVLERKLEKRQFDLLQKWKSRNPIAD
jgi:hypothetical protein